MLMCELSSVVRSEGMEWRSAWADGGGPQLVSIASVRAGAAHQCASFCVSESTGHVVSVIISLTSFRERDPLVIPSSPC